MSNFIISDDNITKDNVIQYLEERGISQKEWITKSVSEARKIIKEKLNKDSNITNTIMMKLVLAEAFLDNK